MATVTPTPVPDLATALPDPSDRTTYGTRGRAVWDWEVNQMVPAINQLAEDTFTNAETAEESALIAVASANFKGAWSSLTGALNVPAAVWHNSRVWALLVNLADVTTSQPGVSADWVDIGGVKRSGDTMTGPLSVPAGASGPQVPQAQEVPGIVRATVASDTQAGAIEIATASEAQNGTDTTRAITPAGLRSALNASGSAPVYACRAWVNFNGTGTPAIRASGNVSSVTDMGTGRYTINFTTAMPDTKYAAIPNSAATACISRVLDDLYARTVSGVTIANFNTSLSDVDPTVVQVAVFR